MKIWIQLFCVASLLSTAPAIAEHEGDGKADGLMCTGSARLKKLDIQLKHDHAIAVAQGKVESSKARAKSLASVLKRTKELVRNKSLPPAREIEVEGQSRIADIATEEAAEALNMARAEKEMAEEEAKCKSGESPDSKGVEKAYRKIFELRSKQAALAVKKAQVEVDTRSFELRAVKILVASKAVDARVEVEASGLLDAANADLAAAQSALKQMKNSIGTTD